MKPTQQEDVRIIQSDHLTPEEIEALDGAVVLDPPEWDKAIVGIWLTAEEEAAAVYDYKKLVQIIANGFALALASAEQGNDEDDPELMAVEWIEFNTMRALPYMGPRAPHILTFDEEGNEVGGEEDDLANTDPDS